MTTRVQRFWEKVQKTDGCWLWLAYKQPRGYGQFKHQGRMRLAHRFSWELTNGLIPEGECVLHTCDNPACVNPEHLFLGTQLDNSLDMYEKGRQAPSPACAGETNGRAKLSATSVGLVGYPGEG